ncbi:MAG TPA: alpha-(1-_3)-arabinofuranosyltransferase family protein [Candidatus Saccharimonadales bacterium]|nr:alpha-(1->3)-arabinofuranosyltransferase family protein [Candidatus Saccharimonadales bacterium]
MKKWFIYLGLSLTVLLPMLLPGYIFALDMVFAPDIRLPDQVTSSYPFYALLHFLNVIVPSQVLQKLLLLAILVLSGVGAYDLVRWLQRTPEAHKNALMWGAYIAGGLYMINPFTYSRFMVGQFAVLLGYALLPFFALALLKLFERPGIRRALILAAWAAGIGVVSIHTVGLACILILLSIPLLIHRYRANPKVLLRIGTYSLVSIGVTVLASAYWLVPLLTGESRTADAIAGFNTGDREAFATVGGDVLNRVANVLQLQGFWAEGTHTYLLPQYVLPIWFVVVIGLWIVAGMGVSWMIRHGQRFAVGLFGGAAMVAVVLSATSLSYTVADHVPLFAGYREPQKFAGLLALAYAVAVGFGADSLLERARQSRSEGKLAVTTIAVLLLPFLLTPTMFWAFGNQLTPREYPNDWYAVNDRLNQEPGEGRVLFLPWHLYMSFSFSGRIVANPAEQFFDRPTIVSNELEYAGASPTMPDKEKTALGALLRDARQGKADLADRLAGHGIKYILLSKDDDYEAYDYIANQPGIRLIQTTGNIELYRNDTYGRQP